MSSAEPLEFVDELPTQHPPRPAADYLRVAAELRANPGRWAKLPEYLVSSYTSVLAIGRGLGPVAFRGGEFEAATRNGHTYLRHMPLPTEEPLS